MTQIPLLCAGLEQRVESRKVRTGRLKGRKRVGATIILKIIVSGEFLGGRNTVIQSHSELVGAQVPVAAGDQVAAGIGLGLKRRNILLVNTRSRRIKARSGNFVAGENIGIQRPGSGHGTSGIGYGRRATWPA